MVDLTRLFPRDCYSIFVLLLATTTLYSFYCFEFLLMDGYGRYKWLGTVFFSWLHTLFIDCCFFIVFTDEFPRLWLILVYLKDLSLRSSAGSYTITCVLCSTSGFNWQLLGTKTPPWIWLGSKASSSLLNSMSFIVNILRNLQ
jgi:hypothetical protein